MQRDFGIYVVNMFDTAEAAGVLQLPKASLRGLLLHFCDIEVLVLPTACPRSSFLWAPNSLLPTLGTHRQAAYERFAYRHDRQDFCTCCSR